MQVDLSLKSKEIYSNYHNALKWEVDRFNNKVEEADRVFQLFVEKANNEFIKNMEIHNMIYNKDFPESFDIKESLYDRIGKLPLGVRSNTDKEGVLAIV